jgi:hypothetical protein
MSKKISSAISKNIQTLSSKIQVIKGSLESMTEIYSIIDEIASASNLKQKHIDHMAACDKVLTIHMKNLYEEQSQLIALLQQQ